MITVNGRLIEQNRFNDNTLKCLTFDRDSSRYGDHINITWCYDDDTELFTLICIVDYLRDYYINSRYDLYLPYIPNARQDRYVANKLFTLKSFANIINGLHFANVYVVDPHSDVSAGLIDRCRIVNIDSLVDYGEYDAVVYPDATAAKKYYNPCVRPIIGSKHRNNQGYIDFYTMNGLEDGIKKVIIRDDICSTGGTIVKAAQELKRHGVERIDLFVSHLENTVDKLGKDVFELIDTIYTTDSIYTGGNPKIKFLKRFR